MPGDKPKVVMVDLDGTLCINVTNRPFHGPGYEKRLHEDKLNTIVRDVVAGLLHAGAADRFLFITGRDEDGREATKAWLMDKAGWWVPDRSLFMRANGDARHAFEVKEELYLKHVENDHDVVLALDDDPSVVEVWRDMCIPTWHVHSHVCE